MFKALDAMDQVKKAFKGLFKSKKNKKTEATATPVTAAEPSAAHATPSQTTPAAPVPATAPAPTPAEKETLPVAPSNAPAEPAALAHVQDESKRDEAAALTVVKEATQSRSTHRPTSDLSRSRPGDEGGGRWRHRVTREDHSDDSVGDTSGDDLCTCI
jgi:hypothetical protein